MQLSRVTARQLPLSFGRRRADTCRRRLSAPVCRASPADAALRQLGRQAIADLIDRTCHDARVLVTRIGNLPGAEVVWTPTINQGLLRFLSPKPGAAAVDHDARTDEVIARIVKSGEAFFGGTTWRGTRCTRVCLQLANERHRHRARRRSCAKSVSHVILDRRSRSLLTWPAGRATAARIPR